MVVAKTDGIHERAGERVRFLNRQNLPGCKGSQFHVAKRIGGTVGSAVIQIRAEQAVFIGKFMVDARGDEIFVHNLLSVEVIWAHTPATVFGNRIERQILLNERISSSRACCRRRNEINARDAFGLPVALVIGKEKCTILYDWPANGSPKLIALEGCLAGAGTLKVVLRIHSAISDEFINPTMKLIGAGTGDGVDHPARSLSIFRGIV